MSNSYNCCTDVCNSCHCHSIHGAVTDGHLLSGYQYPDRNVYIQFVIASYVLCNQEMKDFVAIWAGVGKPAVHPRNGTEQGGLGEV